MTRKEEVSSIYPPIRDLLNPAWVAHPERLLPISPEEFVLKSNALGVKTPTRFPPEILKRLNEGLLLDVGCGINFGIDSTLVDLLPNAYGIDPDLTGLMHHFRTGILPEDRVMSAFAEDMPFKDKTFKWVMSLKCVGWYPNVTVNPYWALSEMIRVTENGGLVTIMIGQKEGNGQVILDAAHQVKEGSLGGRIATIKDFANSTAPQVAIRLL